MSEDRSELHEAWVAEDDMTAGEKALRDSFVTEFLYDRNVFLAAIRAGFRAPFAIEWGKRIYNEPYVQRMIKAFSAPLEDAEEQSKQDFNANAERLRQIRDDPNTKPLERKAAIDTLNVMMGFNKPAGDGGGEAALIDVMKDFASKAPA